MVIKDINALYYGHSITSQRFNATFDPAQRCNDLRRFTGDALIDTEPASATDRIESHVVIDNLRDIRIEKATIYNIFEIEIQKILVSVI